MDLTGFTRDQQQALLDLLVLGMYSDGHLARTEDARIERLLRAMGFHYNYEYQREFDASVTRVTQHSQTSAAALACAKNLAAAFSTPAQRQQVYEALEDLMASDKSVTEKESSFLAVVRGVFKM